MNSEKSVPLDRLPLAFGASSAGRLLSLSSLDPLKHAVKGVNDARPPHLQLRPTRTSTVACLRPKRKPIRQRSAAVGFVNLRIFFTGVYGSFGRRFESSLHVHFRKRTAHLHKEEALCMYQILWCFLSHHLYSRPIEQWWPHFFIAWIPSSSTLKVHRRTLTSLASRQSTSFTRG